MSKTKIGSCRRALISDKNSLVFNVGFNRIIGKTAVLPVSKFTRGRMN